MSKPWLSINRDFLNLITERKKYARYNESAEEVRSRLSQEIERKEEEQLREIAREHIHVEQRELPF